MDRKNLTIGIALLILAFAILMFAPRSAPSTQPASPYAPAAPATAAPGSPATTESIPPTTTFATVHQEAPNAVIATMSNEYIEARFTNFGGAVRDVAFRKYSAALNQPEPYVFNHLHEDPIMAFVDYPGLGRDTPYRVVRASSQEVVYRAVLDDALEVTRTYRLTQEGEPGADPYRIRHETSFRNLTNLALPLPRMLSVGTAALVSVQDVGQYLNIVSYDGKDTHYIERSDLEGGGMASWLGAARPPLAVFEKPGQVAWAGAKNQFFVSLYTPEEPALGVVARRIELPAFAEKPYPTVGLTGAVRFELPALPPNGTARIGGMLYVGPQEYRRLSKFDHDEDKVLPYTQYFFNRIFLSGYVAPFLNMLMNATHRWFGNWGMAIVVMTLILKIVTLPFTVAASRSAKRMGRLQPLMQEIREKYKDNPQKQQMATMELFKTHKINPLGGCIPILITMPLFVGFFAMLLCTAELRFQSFLWTKDLAAPDTIGYIFGIPLNIMPLLMGATMYFSMRLTPTPSVDNMQVKMMRFMPVIFTLFCYNFSAALALYSTVNGLFTIGQQMVINRIKDDPGPSGPVTAAATTSVALGKGLKNVTPTKKKSEKRKGLKG
jgi:YidC/Oxa1 family membrane protein insertase